MHATACQSNWHAVLTSLWKLRRGVRHLLRLVGMYILLIWQRIVRHGFTSVTRNQRRSHAYKVDAAKQVIEMLQLPTQLGLGLWVYLPQPNVVSSPNGVWGRAPAAEDFFVHLTPKSLRIFAKAWCDNKDFAVPHTEVAQQLLCCPFRRCCPCVYTVDVDCRGK